MESINQLDRELGELKSFIADLKADRAAQTEKERREGWTKYTSLSLVFIAVFAAIATQWSGKYSGRALSEMNNSILHQAKASDKWSYYQAKSIKQNLYEALREVAPNGGGDGAGSPQALEAFNAKVAKYKADEAAIMAEAQKLEEMQRTAQASALLASGHAAGMGLSIAVFQIAIALSSICLITKKQPLWYVSIALALIATAKMAQVWLS